MESRLYLETASAENGTYIKDVYFTSPYKIMSPFKEGRHMDVMQMSASAGLLDGDCFQGEFVFGANSDVTYLSQSYEKVFRTKNRQAVKKIDMQVDSGAKVKYLPYPVIPFGGSDFLSETTVHMKENITFLYGDIFTCGRTGMGEYFQMKRYESTTKIYIENRLVFADHTLIFPEKFHYNTLGMWNSYTHNGMLYIHVQNTKREQELVETIREKFTEGKWLLGVSTCHQGIVVRVLSMSGEQIYNIFQSIGRLV